MENFLQDLSAFFKELGCHLSHSPAYAFLHIDAECASAMAMVFVGVLTLPFPVVGLPLIALGIWELVRWTGIFIACQLRRECAAAIPGALFHFHSPSGGVMGIEDLLGHFVSEVARRSVDHLAACAGPVRICDHCNNVDRRPISLTLPCCGRVLCGPCTARALVYRWETRAVVVCDDCQTAHTFEAPH